MRTLHVKIVTGLLSLGLFMGCSKSHVKTDPAACCQKPEQTEKNTVASQQTNASSIYQLSGSWADQFGNRMDLKQLDGKVQLVAMIFTHCGYACPKMVDNMKAIEAQLPAALKKQVGFVLVTFDTERDNPAQLGRYARQKQLGDSWHLLQGSPEQVRVLSMLLETRYDRLANGDFNHSNILTILDKQGTIVKQIEGLDTNPDEALAMIIQLFQK